MTTTQTAQMSVAKIAIQIFATLFAIIGVLTALNTIASFTQTGVVSYQALLYVALNATFAYGLFKMRGWAFVISLANLAFAALAIGDLLFSDTKIPTYQIILLLLNALLCLSLLKRVATLRGAWFSVLPITLFFVARIFPTLATFF